MIDVTALGEVLIDFTPAGTSENGQVQFERNPGGAPANVLAALTKLGRTAAFIGKVGDDQFGHYLREVLANHHIRTEGCVLSRQYHTTLAFVHLAGDGDRSFTFYRKPGADMMLEQQEVKTELIDQSSIFHFGSLSMTDEPAYTATLSALKYARQKNVLISYDPNLRPALWSDMEQARERILNGFEFADLVKISEEELAFITGMEELEAGTAWLREQFDTKLILVTLGAAGCFYRLGDRTGHVSGFQVKAVDTTGAGDSFLGGLLLGILEHGGLEDLEESQLQANIRFANAVGALVTTQMGAIPAMPTRQEVLDFMQQADQ
ncbi:PfkB family carbohydrate kinase [Marinicrinis sediminis]|uniref:PfkB family carbohydrate kinase n=1 Tax=Marinicrinis sediminis TaxID=1652465 RepID=A0ABW5RBY0_9BACL